MAKQSGLPAQAIPIDKRAPEPPPPFEDMLPSGITVQWRMPDPFAVVAFDGVVPDPITAATIKLLKDEGAYTHENDPRKFRADAQSFIGMYALAGAMLEKPRLDIDREYGDGNGTIGRREIAKEDVRHLYALFCYFAPSKFVHATDPAQPERPTDAAPDGERVRADASGADAD